MRSELLLAMKLWRFRKFQSALWKWRRLFQTEHSQGCCTFQNDNKGPLTFNIFWLFLFVGVSQLDLEGAKAVGNCRVVLLWHVRTRNSGTQCIHPSIFWPLRCIQLKASRKQKHSWSHGCLLVWHSWWPSHQCWKLPLLGWWSGRY